MPAYTLNINGKPYPVRTSEHMPLLWVLREIIGLTGTKFGCGKGFCGACIVHADGEVIRACITPINAIQNKPIITIEGLSPDHAHPLQRAWQQQQVSPCGACRAGQIMAAAALLDKYGRLTEAIIEREMDGVLCRCGSYPRIKQAILSVAKQAQTKG